MPTHSPPISLREAVRNPTLPLAGDQDSSEATEAGNYFVANYPPFSFWKPDYLPRFHEVTAEPPTAASSQLGIYFHIPFCRKRCHFCYFKVYTDRNAAEIQAYLQAAIQEFKLYSHLPFFQGRKPQFVYFGGGTPSYLSVKQLTALVQGMQEHFPWDQAEEVAFECEPGTLTEKKLAAIRDLGVTRLSLGVENFDDDILELNGRAHRSPELHRALRFAQSLGFPQINIDLIAGMVNETEENWRHCVAQTLEYSPECVTIYQMEIPYNTTIYQEMKVAGKLSAPVANWETKRRWVAYAFAELEKAGYTVTSATTAVKNPAETHFVYRDSLWSGADLLSAGVASFGHAGGVHYQNDANIGGYMNALDEGRLPVYRAYETSVKEQFLREFMLRLKLGKVECQYYLDKYGFDPQIECREPLENLQAQGFLRLDANGTITLSRDGLMRVDQWLHQFFLPEHQNARYT